MSPLVWAKYFPSLSLPPTPKPLQICFIRKKGVLYSSPPEKEIYAGCHSPELAISMYSCHGVLTSQFFGTKLEYFAKSHKPVKTYRTENGILTF